MNKGNESLDSTGTSDYGWKGFEKPFLSQNRVKPQTIVCVCVHVCMIAAI